MTRPVPGRHNPSPSPEESKEPTSPPGKDDPSKSAGVLASLLKTDNVQWVAIAVLLIVMVYLRGGSVAVKKDEVRIEFPAPGTTLVRINGQPDKGSYLLSASDLWADTGLILKPKQRVHISASGRANLAVHRLVEAAQRDTRPTLDWIGPGGSNGITVHSTYRSDLRIVPKAQDGVLLAYLHKKGDPIPSKENPRPEKLIVIGASCEIPNDTDEERVIWLTVNDSVLSNDETSKLAFLEVESLNDSTIKDRPAGFPKMDEGNPLSWTPYEHWEYIVKQQYWNLWYDDNVGFFHVQFDYKLAQ